MLKLFMIFSILLLQSAAAGINISGNIKTEKGEAPQLAHVHVSYLGNSVYRPFKSIEISKEGTFSLDLEDGKYYTLFITAANHYGLQLPILYDDNTESITLNVQLDPYEFNKDAADIKIIGDWNNFKFASAKDMQKQADGTYLFEVKSDSAIVGYQLYGIEKQGHSINGTNYDALKYDGGGDYISYVHVNKGLARIVFDPDRLLESDKDLPLIDFGDNKALTIINQIEKKDSEISAAYRQHEATVKDGSKFDWSEMDALLQKHISSDKPVVRRFVASKYAAMVYAGFDNVDMQKILSISPITDPLWELNYYGAYTFLKNALGRKKADAYIEENFSQIESVKVRAGLLAMQGLDAKSNDNQALMTEIFNKLDSEYKDVSEISYFKNQLDPSKAITKGKKVPEFEVKLIHSEEIVSRESLLGKYYLLDFWAVWCGPCRREMPNMHKVYEEFKTKNFTILSLSFDHKPEAVDTYRKDKWAMPWLHTYIENSYSNPLSKRFEVTGIPKPILVNPQGIIVATGMELRGEELRKTLDKYLNTTM